MMEWDSVWPANVGGNGKSSQGKKEERTQDPDGRPLALCQPTATGLLPVMGASRVARGDMRVGRSATMQGLSLLFQAGAGPLHPLMTRKSGGRVQKRLERGARRDTLEQCTR